MGYSRGGSGGATFSEIEVEPDFFYLLKTILTFGLATASLVTVRGYSPAKRDKGKSRAAVMLEPHNTAAERRLPPTSCSPQPAPNTCRSPQTLLSPTTNFHRVPSHPIPCRVSLCFTLCPGQIVPLALCPCLPAYTTLPERPCRETLRNPLRIGMHRPSLLATSELSPPTGKWRPQYEGSETRILRRRLSCHRHHIVENGGRLRLRRYRLTPASTTVRCERPVGGQTLERRQKTPPGRPPPPPPAVFQWGERLRGNDAPWRN